MANRRAGKGRPSRGGGGRREGRKKRKKRESIGQLTDGWLVLVPLRLFLVRLKAAKGALITQLGRKGRLIYLQRHR